MQEKVWKKWLNDTIVKAVSYGKLDLLEAMKQGGNQELHLWIKRNDEDQYGDIALFSKDPQAESEGSIQWELWHPNLINTGTPYDQWHTLVRNAVQNAPVLGYHLEQPEREQAHISTSRPRG